MKKFLFWLILLLILGLGDVFTALTGNPLWVLIPAIFMAVIFFLVGLALLFWQAGA